VTKRWSDFLFAVVVRLICGLILGALAGLIVGWRAVLRWEAREKTAAVAFWFIAWAVGGGIIAILRIPRWQTPWYTRLSDSDRVENRDPLPNHGSVPPELYNRATHPSPKQYQDFIAWLRQDSIADLRCVRGDESATKAALIIFFQRGFRAGLTAMELTELLPSALNGVGYSDAEYGNVVSTANTLDLQAIRSSVREGCQGC
jgi:hypothetical protein